MRDSSPSAQFGEKSLEFNQRVRQLPEQTCSRLVRNHRIEPNNSDLLPRLKLKIIFFLLIMMRVEDRICASVRSRPSQRAGTLHLRVRSDQEQKTVVQTFKFAGQVEMKSRSVEQV
uniref:Uncharacterized protein n=1 Tax=Opuntia streptacantha TaxID=393608 RepID=A0A7C9D3J0_OPUST